MRINISGPRQRMRSSRVGRAKGRREKLKYGLHRLRVLVKNDLEPPKKMQKADFFRIVTLTSPEPKSEESLVGTVEAFFSWAIFKSRRL